MKKFLLIVVFGIFHYQLFAQTAEDALSEFDWLTNYVERNYPGYKYRWEESPTSKKKHPNFGCFFYLWELTDSNRRPSACKADALNQLS